MASQKSFF
ncbi:uncharacterized protein FFNC_15679 [Fusarium fujikuroi]|nr:uncharacterized protein FFNC_15679 [Fusarium fujikuroi]